MGNLAPAGGRKFKGASVECQDSAAGRYHSHPRPDRCRNRLREGQTALTQTLPTLPGRVLIVFDEPSQPKVSHFAHEVLSNQDVGSTEVPVDIVHPFHVGHA